jgi:acyl-CoA synthetase (NDP forming)
MPLSLAPLLSPRSIAYLGASRRPDTPGNDMMRMIRKGGFPGAVFGVNPAYDEVEGYPCVPSFAELPAPPDLAVLSVRNDRLEESLAQAIAAGARAAVVFASAQLAPEVDPPLAERLRAMAAAADMPICGPNCMGFYNDLDRVWVCGFPSPREPRPGRIAFVAHSGSVFGALCHNDPRLRFALAISPGQELNATVADYVLEAVERPEVAVVGLFLEAARDPVRFRRALERAAELDKPVVVLKVGRTEAAAAAALSHTGAIVGADGAYDALFDATGAIRVETLDELAATLLLLEAGRHAGPGGLVSIHDSGGEREMTIDLADRIGVPFAAIAPTTRAEIAARLEPGLEAANPLDAWGTGKDFATAFADLFAALLVDPQAGVGLFGVDLRDGSYLYRGFADAALAARARSDKPFAVATNYSQVRHDRLALELTEKGVPVLDGTAAALVALRGALHWRDVRARGPDPPPAPPPDLAAARMRALARLAAGAAHDEAAGLALLAAWGIPTIAHGVAESEAQALARAAAIGFPVALKTAAPGVAHKSDVGGVRLGLADAEALRAAYGEMAARLGPRVLVAALAPRGVELALGMTVDPQFGPVVMAGAGGVLVEVLDDRATALAPFGPATARRLLARLKLARLFGGYRGLPPVDLDALAAVVARFSVLAADIAPHVRALDVNPLMCGPRLAALDCLVDPGS